MRRRSIEITFARWVIFIVVGGYLLLPLVAMGEFSTRGDFGARSLDAWFAIGDNQNLVGSIIVTVLIAALTAVGMVLLLVPTMAWLAMGLAFFIGGKGRAAAAVHVGLGFIAFAIVKAAFSDTTPLHGGTRGVALVVVGLLLVFGARGLGRRDSAAPAGKELV